jgi:hypothetical protein
MERRLDGGRALDDGQDGAEEEYEESGHAEDTEREKGGAARGREGGIESAVEEEDGQGESDEEEDRDDEGDAGGGEGMLGISEEGGEGEGDCAGEKREEREFFGRGRGGLCAGSFVLSGEEFF